MGLKKLFSRGKKVPKETAQPITPTLTPTGNINEDGISRDNSESIRTPASSISNQVSKPVPSHPHSSDLIRDKDTHQDLWDQAYANLSQREPDLTTRYEEIILMQEKDNSSPSQENLGWSTEKFLKDSAD